MDDMGASNDIGENIVYNDDYNSEKNIQQK